MFAGWEERRPFGTPSNYTEWLLTLPPALWIGDNEGPALILSPAQKSLRTTYYCQFSAQLSRTIAMWRLAVSPAAIHSLRSGLVRLIFKGFIKHPSWDLTFGSFCILSHPHLSSSDFFSEAHLQSWHLPRGLLTPWSAYASTLPCVLLPCPQYNSRFEVFSGHRWILAPFTALVKVMYKQGIINTCWFTWDWPLPGVMVLTLSLNQHQLRSPWAPREDTAIRKAVLLFRDSDSNLLSLRQMMAPPQGLGYGDEPPN